MSTGGDDGFREPTAATYWRRRLVALMVGAGTIALIAWAFSGLLGRGVAATDAANQTHHTTRPSGSTSHPVSPSPLVSPTPGSPSPTVSASPRVTPPVTTPTAQPTPSAGVANCPTGDVVLTLTVSNPGQPNAQQLDFQVLVVSVARHPCVFDIGSKHLALIIRSGTGRIWSSSDCARGDGSHAIELHRGVPAIVPFTWNRTASTPGCAGPAVRVPSGDYTATAVAGQLTSNSLTVQVG